MLRNILKKEKLWSQFMKIWDTPKVSLLFQGRWEPEEIGSLLLLYPENQKENLIKPSWQAGLKLPPDNEVSLQMKGWQKRKLKKIFILPGSTYKCPNIWKIYLKADWTKCKPILSTCGCKAKISYLITYLIACANVTCAAANSWWHIVSHRYSKFVPRWTTT